MAIAPSSGSSSPATRRRVVDFPPPLGPTTTTISPRATESDTASSAAGEPRGPPASRAPENRLLTRSSRISGSGVIASLPRPPPASFGRGFAPPLLGARPVFSRVDFHVAAVGVDAMEGGAPVDHLLEEIEEVGALEGAPVAPGAAGLGAPRLVERGHHPARSVGRELHDADELPARLL